MGRIIAIIGAGGKTTTLLSLAEKLQNQRVLLTTTTHIYPVTPPESRVLLTDPDEAQLLQALKVSGVVCAGRLSEPGKLSSLDEKVLKKAAAAADITLCEADGAKMHPLKLHRKGEPAILEDTDCCVVVAGLSALGQPISQVIHRYEREPRWLRNPEKLVGMEEIMRCLEDALSLIPQACSKKVLLNQLDKVKDADQVVRMLDRLREMGVDAHAGSLHTESKAITDWILAE